MLVKIFAFYSSCMFCFKFFQRKDEQVNDDEDDTPASYDKRLMTLNKFWFVRILISLLTVSLSLSHSLALVSHYSTHTFSQKKILK